MTDMSMLSAQCDDLRQMAESVGLAMPQAATLMMEAADTIWELRESVHRERTEADILRQQLADVTESMGRVEERCAKLRELAGELWEGYADPPCEDCPFRDTPTCADCPICARETAVLDRMRELGVEVDV